MDLLNPWNQINLRAVTKGEQLQFYDTNIRFIYTLVGGITIQKEGEKVHLGNDDFYILTKSQWYELSHISGKVFMVTLEYNGGQLGQVQRLFQGDSINNPRVVDEEVARSVKQLLLLRATSTESLTNLIYKEYFTLVSLLEKYYSIVVSLRDMTQGKNRIIEVKNYIDLYFDKELTLGELAKKIYVSEQYLSKIFKDEFGIGVSEYIIRKRLEKVRKFLTETEYPITDIAFDAGFTNINSFNRLFKKYQGVTPSTYRQETKSHVTTLSRTESLESEEFTVVAEYIENDLKETHHHTIGVSVNETTDYQLPELLINLGFAEDLLHRSYIKTVEPIQRYVPFQYGRVCGIFDQNIMVEVDGEFDFTKVDDVIQAIFDLGLKPFLELGMKGKFIFDSDYNPILEQEIQLPTNRLEDLLRRYQALLAHCVDYYGVDEVGSWKIELWKPSAYLQKMSSMKQQVVFTYQGESLSLLTEAGYRRYFKIASRAIKAVVPCIAVGGCGFQVNFIKEGLLSELEGWLQSDDQPDFLSFYAFPIENIGNTTTIDISSNVDYIRDALHVLRHRLSHLAPLIPVYMTEFNVTIHHRAIINDTCFKGPYILKNIFTQMAGVQLVGYWQLSDFSSLAVDVAGQEVFGGPGLISKNGIAKPAFYAFDFMKNLGSQLVYRSDNMVVTREGSKILLIAYHYCHLNSQYYYDNKIYDKNNALDMFEEDGINKVSVVLDGLLVDGQYQIKRRKMGVHDGALIWQANQFSNRTKYRSDEIDYLQHRFIPTLSKFYSKATNGTLTIDLELAGHDMVFVEVSPA